MITRTCLAIYICSYRSRETELQIMLFIKPVKQDAFKETCYFKLVYKVLAVSKEVIRKAVTM